MSCVVGSTNARVGYNEMNFQNSVYHDLHENSIYHSYHRLMISVSVVYSES